MTAGEAFLELTGIMARLRAPGGCPWDREQTHATIKPYLIEEAYEVIEAIDDGDGEELKNELGDLLLQVVFHAQMADEAGSFSIVEVVEAICEKMRRRHPHVFGDVQVSGSEEVLHNWSRIKAAERAESGDRSAIAGVPRGMPALLRAQRLGEKASRVGFDWERPADVIAKVREEIDELADAVRDGDAGEIEAEVGDLLFAAANLARHCGLNAEAALATAADRFSDRFRRMEAWLEKRGRNLRDATPEEQNEAWEAIKAAANGRE